MSRWSLLRRGFTALGILGWIVSICFFYVMVRPLPSFRSPVKAETERVEWRVCYSVRDDHDNRYHNAKLKYGANNIPYFGDLSPDGTRIAYSDLGSGISIVNTDGTAQRQITFPTAESDESPTWSPDGTTLVFERLQDRAQDGSIYTVSADGTNLHRITSEGFNPVGVYYSSDGSHIVYYTDGIGCKQVHV